MENEYETALRDILCSDEHATATPNKQSESWFPSGRVKEYHVSPSHRVEAAYKKIKARPEYLITRTSIGPHAVITHARTLRKTFINHELASHITSHERLLSEANRSTNNQAEKNELEKEIRSLALAPEPTATARRSRDALQTLAHRITNVNMLTRYRDFLSADAKQSIQEAFDTKSGDIKFADVVDHIANWVTNKASYTNAHRLICFQRTRGQKNMKLLADALAELNFTTRVPPFRHRPDDTSTSTEAPEAILHDEVMASILDALITAKERRFLQSKIRDKHDEHEQRSKTLRSFAALRTLFKEIVAEEMPSVTSGRFQRLSKPLNGVHAEILASNTRSQSRTSHKTPTGTPPPPKRALPIKLTDEDKANIAKRQRRKKQPVAAVYKDGVMTKGPIPFRSATLKDIDAWESRHGAYIFLAKGTLSREEIQRRLRNFICLHCGETMTRKTHRFHHQVKCHPSQHVTTGTKATPTPTKTVALASKDDATAVTPAEPTPGK